MLKRRIIISLCAAVILTACSQTEQRRKPLVVTSIAPLGDWIAAVGGDDVDVLVLVPPSSNPHTFELSPGQLRDASEASLVVLNGAGLEYWSDRLLDNMRTADISVVTLADSVELLQDGGHDGHDHAHAAGNPHFWLDPVIAAAAVRRIAIAVAALLPPDRGDAIVARMNAYVGELRRLDAEIRNSVSRWKQRRFIGDHSSWVYFARRYGLEEAGVIESVPGREVSARELSSLIGLMRKQGIDVVFADRSKSTRSVDILAEESGARVALLDPLGASGLGYIPLLRSNVREMTAVMR